MEERKQEFRTGLAVVIGLVILSGLIIFAGGLQFLQDYYAIKVNFDSAGGVKRGAPVRMAGVEIGRVSNISIRTLQNNKAIVEFELEIQNTFKISTDSKIAITSDSLLGERFLEITPGIAISYLAAGETMPEFGLPPGTIDDALKGIPRIVESLQITLDGVNKIVADPRVQSDVRAVIENLRSAVANADSLTKDLRSLLSEEREGIHNIVTGGKEAIDKLNKFVDGLETTKTEVYNLVKFVRAETEKLAANINDPALVATAKSALAKFEALPEKLDSLITTLKRLSEEDATAVLTESRKTIEDLHATVLQTKKDLAEIAESIKTTIELTRTGDGILAAVLTDKVLKEKANALVDQGMYLLEHPILFMLKGGYKQRREEPKKEERPSVGAKETPAPEKKPE